MTRIATTFGRLGICVAATMALSAQTVTTLASFDQTDGSQPWAGLVQGLDGDFYGTTSAGGAGGAGTVFKISAGGALTTLHSFCTEAGCPDGSTPYAGVVQATGGDFYGTTWNGGANSAGTVFKITSTGVLTTLYSFCSQPLCTDGAYASAGLVEGENGDLYGATYGGGVYGSGAIYRISPRGAFSPIYSFCALSGCPDGLNPYGGLLLTANGDLYGTTFYGGTGAEGGGTVFRITPAGTLTTLHSFCAQSRCADGGNPRSTLLQTAGGNFYGTAESGGSNLAGTVFKLTASGDFTTLYSFCSQDGCADGTTPYGGLVQGSDGEFYGTTTSDGANGGGTIFRITSAGALTTLFSFFYPNCAPGYSPLAAVIQSTNGLFYGTTVDGCEDGGSVFSLSVGLGPFVETRPTFGKVGSLVKVLGNGLTGSTSVKFHGASAAFEVVSSTEIVARVPVGAGSGEVQVVAPGGTLESNGRFRIIP